MRVKFVCAARWAASGRGILSHRRKIMAAIAPRLLEPAQLAALLEQDDGTLLVLHAGNPQSYAEGHIPGALYVPPKSLMCGVPPATGQLPQAEELSRIFSAIGLHPKRHVVACDDEGGGWAGRLLWTLDVLGHEAWSYLNGGIVAWRDAGLPLATEPGVPTPSDFQAQIHRRAIAEAEDILQKLGEPNFAVWDARSRAEYDGQRVLSKRGGHIPGAVHWEWLELIDTKRSLRLRELEEIDRELEARGLGAQQHIVTHCQSHHRSALCYLAGRLLGRRIQGYHGSWSEWGNRDDTPVEM